MKLIKLLFWGLFMVTTNLVAQIKLPQLISDGMVLQRNTETTLWGWASPNEQITCKFKGKAYKVTANKLGDWSITLPAQTAGGPYKITFTGKNKIELKNILFGDVWVCSGQSNMVTPMERVKERYPIEVSNASYDEIRNFFIPTTTNLISPEKDLPKSQWKPAVEGDIMSMGAVSYFFAKKIYEKYKVPIGIINASVGGTPIQSWISEDGFKTFPEDLNTISQNKDTSYTNQFTVPPSTKTEQKLKDMGLLENPKWYNPAASTTDWYNFYIPGYWEDQGIRNLDGVVWFRKEITVPEALLETDVKFFMGRIVDADEVYVNGTKIGNITYQYPPRRYTVPKGVLKKGSNTIVIRVTNYNGKGGFVPDKNYELTANGVSIDLKGEWRYKVGEVFAPNPKGYKPATYNSFWAQNQPTSLYNAMLAPITALNVKGFLWYQGESNSGNPTGYGTYLKALIKDMRNQFNAPEAPFLFVQLANYQDVDYLPTESNWAALRFEQFTALTEPKTAMAVAIDLGEWNDIHPLNKKDVGERLALGALKLGYGEDIVYSGPLFSATKVVGNSIVISFDQIGSGLVAIDDKPLHRFEIAGEDQEFIWADAKIVNNTVVVSHEQIEHPRYVRYAWADNPQGANLYNKEGLPASPFQNYNPIELNKIPWQGKKAAVVLTYDDALNVHLDHAVPVLDSLGLKGTFYVSTFSDAFRNRLKEWKQIVQNGHELGNHTIYHPCIGKEDRPWVNKNYDMATYTVERMVDEIKINNTLLEALDNKKKRTFAYTCGDFTVNGENTFIEYLKDDVIGARAVRPQMHTINEIDLYNLDSYPIVGETGEELITLVKQAIEKKALLIFLFHGVGGEHAMDVSLPAHRKLLEYLKANETEVWTAPMIDVIHNIKEATTTN
ncbi:hypothetical protein BUL40_13855 [Croceivirga radicis]|uniref:NodB homology domain-containing protein n=1 Tax=Croceivirga radicis TaxID=1929488 RepID=A0A1V6LP18_9FLAO|nr:sialate O-acetylesterase [Croceivirga radicis]OQD41931.1 hypothetical protein BUL40_13855 [Croceivirga radicis]